MHCYLQFVSLFRCTPHRCASVPLSKPFIKSILFFKFVIVNFISLRRRSRKWLIVCKTRSIDDVTEKKCYRVNMNPVYSLNVYIKLQAHSLILRLKDLKFYRPDNRKSRTRNGSIEPLYIATHLNGAI